MARGATGRTRELPPPLPPETRTVGQLIAEAIRLYGKRFWWALLLGLPPAVLEQATVDRSFRTGLVIFVAAAPLLLTLSYAGACVLVAPERPPRRAVLLGYAAGVLVYLPVPLLLRLYILPAAAWLALTGLSVPAAVLERLPLRRALARGIDLARADYVHALGSLAALVIVGFLSRAVLFFLLRGTGETGLRVAAFLADLVISPVLFLGAALLYFDQEARLSARLARDTIPGDERLPRRKPDAPGTVRHATPRGPDRGAHDPGHDRP